jgi:hypothetical protein
VKRAASLLLVAACGSSPPRVAPVPNGDDTAKSGGGASDYPPAQFKPPTNGLAVGVATFLVIDDVHGRVLVRRNNGIDVLALDSGAKKARVEIGWDGDIYPAQPNVLAVRSSGVSIDVALVDPVVAKLVAKCSTSAKMPAGSIISRVDEFTTHAGTTYLKWEGAAPSTERHGGAAVRPEEVDRFANNFAATYACGLLVVHASGTACTLDPASYKDAGLDSCETRMMPWPRYLPTPIGSLALSVERSSTQRTGLYVDVETFIVRSTSGGERWRLPIETRATPPPAP